MFFLTLLFNVPQFLFLSDLGTIIALNCRPLTNLSFDPLLEVAETLFAANVNFDDFAAEWLMPDMNHMEPIRYFGN